VERDRRRDRLALGAILAVAAALRFGYLSARGWWFDETFTLGVVDLDVRGVVDYVLQREGSPPLYFVLTALWARVAGSSEAGLRSLTATFGLASVWLAYAAAARLASVRAGLVAAALAAVNPMLVWFSLDARVYALLVLVGGWSFLAFARALEAPRAATFAEWALASALALWTHYFAIFPVAAEALWLLRRHPRRRALYASLLALGVAGAGLVPFMLAAASGVNSAWTAGRDWRVRLASVPPEFLLGFQPPRPILLGPLAMLIPAVALWLLAIRADDRERRAALTAGGIAAVSLSVPALLMLVPEFDIFLTRYLSAATVPVLVVLAAGLGARRAGRAGLVTVGAACVLGVAIDVGTAHVSKFEHEDWRGAARALAPADVVRVLVVTPPRGFVPLRWYRPGLEDVPDGDVDASEIVLVALPPIFRDLGHPSVPPRPPSPTPPDAAFREVERVEADGFTLVRYRAPQASRLPRERLEAMRLAPAEEARIVLERP
jgi:hypothetical protein